MPPVTELSQLCGAYVNLEYTLSNGQKVKFLDDRNIYLGYQLEKIDSDRCYGLVADDEYLLVCEYGCNGADPEIIVYKKRNVWEQDMKDKKLWWITLPSTNVGTFFIFEGGIYPSE